MNVLYPGSDEKRNDGKGAPPPLPTRPQPRP
jgi:hypothetical protein